MKSNETVTIDGTWLKLEIWYMVQPCAKIRVHFKDEVISEKAKRELYKDETRFQINGTWYDPTYIII